MLSRPRRLRSAEVRNVLAKGRALRPPAPAEPAGGAIISARTLSSAVGGMRAAVVVPKSVAKSAVARNRLRRAAYAALAELRAGAHNHTHTVFFLRGIPRPPLRSALRAQIGGIIEQIAKNEKPKR